MKAPDKIYIDEDLINYHCLTYRCEGDLEYICKDALPEWLIEQRDCSVYTDQDAYEAFQEIIDKINLM